MFNLFKNKIQSAWGLHFTDKFLRAVELEKGMKPWKVKRVSRKELAPDIVKNGLIIKSKLFQEYLERMKNQAYPSSFQSPYVIMNAPEQRIFISTVQLPTMKEEEVEEAIKWEAESNIPLPIEKVYISWKLLPEKADKKVNVLLTATPKEIIDAIIESLNKIGLTPLIIEPESTALVRNILENNPEDLSKKPFLIVNVGEQSTRFIVFDRKAVRLSTTTNEIASAHFDQAIQEKLGVKGKETEKLRKDTGWDENSKLGKKIIEATKEPTELLKREIKNTLAFYEERGLQGEKINNILLTGKRKNKWPGFDTFLEKEIKKPVSWELSWKEEQWFKKSPFIKREREEYTAAIGLALRGMEDE